MTTIAIVGGGPAGAMAAERLMRGNGQSCERLGRVRVVIYEERLDWEKPCGGGLSQKALKEFPFLQSAVGLSNSVWKIEMRAPGGATVRLNLRQPLVVYSRRELNHLLLQRSEFAGAEVVKDRIVRVARAGDQWRLTGRNGSYEADYLILAAGARSCLRNELAGAFKTQDFMLTYGYYVPAHEDLLRIGFFENFEGYAWSFPRSDHLSVGICGKAGQCKMAELQGKLHQFMEWYGYSADSAPVFSHLLPSLEVSSWANLRLEGHGWALVGDVAGFTDPVTGEGLHFALRSGELLAESLLQGSSYAQRAWNEFGFQLMLGARICREFYHGQFLGAAVTTRMIQFCSRSKTFRDLFQDMVEGRKTYHGLRSRVFRHLPRFILDCAAQTVLGGTGVQSARQV